VVGEVLQAPPPQLGDVLGGEFVVGHRAAGDERCRADQEVVVHQAFVAWRLAGIDDLLMPHMRRIGVNCEPDLFM
jgi:hypothetical protein